MRQRRQPTAFRESEIVGEIEGANAGEGGDACDRVADLAAADADADSGAGIGSSLEVQSHLYFQLAPITSELASEVLHPAANADRAPAIFGSPWMEGLRAIMLLVRLGARYSRVTAPPSGPSEKDVMAAALDVADEGGATAASLASLSPAASVERMIVSLCDASGLPASAGRDEVYAHAACGSARSLISAAAAIAMATSLPQMIGRDGWHRLLRSVLTLLQLGYVPPLSVSSLSLPGAGGTGAAADLGATPAAAAGAAAAVDMAVGTIEGLLAASPPDESMLPWEARQAWRHKLSQVAAPAALLRAALSTPAATEALLAALVRTVDEAVGFAMGPHQHHAAAVSAATPAVATLSLLADVMVVLGPRGPRWAQMAARQRFEQLAALPTCPPPVRQSAAHALERLRHVAAVEPRRDEHGPTATGPEG